MNITIHSSFLPHDDPEAALGFYRDALGFEVRLDVGYEGMRWITVGPADQPDTAIVLTPAGASFPHGHDPRDRNIRLAPSFPVLEEVETAMAGVATCVALAAAEELSGRHTASASTPEGH